MKYISKNVRYCAKIIKYIVVVIVGVFFSRVRNGDILRLRKRSILIGLVIIIGGLKVIVF